MIAPVFVAGLGQVVVLKLGLLDSLATPLDRGAKWRGRPLLGPRKTWRGVVVMSGLSALFASVQAYGAARSDRLRRLSPFDYVRINPAVLGFALGLGYCLAELPNSFVKRRLDIPPAGSAQRRRWVQYIVDQSDSVVGCLVALRLFYRPSRTETGLAFAAGLGLHVGVDLLMRAWGIKRPAYRPNTEVPRTLASAGTGMLSRP